MKEIRGDAKSVRGLLSGAKYAIDYYQREYRWEMKQIAELVDDLSDKFRESYEPGHERSAVEGYGHYFLGSIIVSDRDGQKFLIDGQQRLTSITLLLIFLHRRLTDAEQQAQLAELIFSQKYGQKSFNLNVPERMPCMDALFSGQDLDEGGQPESVVNILRRYQDIEDVFPESLQQEALPYFADWLIENVHLVEITAYSDEDAYTIFETMNDRGLSLTPTDMLKGYLLANITDPTVRYRASNVWRERIVALSQFGKEEDADTIKAWLRSQYAQSIRERRADAKPQDFDLIGTEFHRWIRDHEVELQLLKSLDFAQFIERNFAFYSRAYLKVRGAAQTLTTGLECIFYNADNKFTLQYPVLLAPLRIDDAEPEVERKLGVVSRYLDILIARRIWNFRSIDYSTMQYSMFLVMKEIRGRSATDVAELLAQRLVTDEETFAKNDRFYLHGTNGRQIHRLLARFTTYLEAQIGLAPRYAEYITRSGKHGYEVEHVWANHPERHKDEFSHSSDFEDHRNRIGGLLLLPKSFNASYGDLPYEEKREHYLKQNILAQTFHEKGYERNPGLKRFLEETGLDFEPYRTFRKDDVDERSVLYRQLAERVWDPAQLVKAAAA
jgi:uncharacterized protein with ParB-like and HNH nuclease domain